MTPHRMLPLPDLARIFRSLPESASSRSLNNKEPSIVQRAGFRIPNRLSLALLLILLTLGRGLGVAQQAPPQAYGQYGNPGWQAGDPNGGQQAPAPQSTYGQLQSYDPQGYRNPEPQYPQQSLGQPQQTSLNVAQLEQLVAPIALYPDTVVAQLLAAATYPAQVVEADHWRQAQGYATPEQVVYGADEQNWDPSVKALTAFPQLLTEMDQNLPWTVALGNAYYNQPQDVLDVVQVMRQRAQAAGALQSTPQEAMSYDSGYIQLASPDPQVVYLPTYNPWVAYGDPVQPYPGFSSLGALGSVGSFLGSTLLHYGPGIAMSAFNHTPWGFLQWGLSWLGHSVLFHRSPFQSHSTSLADWGLPHGGPRAFALRGGMTVRDTNGGYRPEPQSGANRQGYNRAGSEWNSYTHLPGRSFVPSQDRNPVRNPTPRLDNRQSQGYLPGYHSPVAGYPRAALNAYNRPQSMPARPQTPVNRVAPAFGSGYGGGMYARPRPGYTTWPDPAFNAPKANDRVEEAHRFPAQEMPRGGFSDRPSSFGSSGEFAGYSSRQSKLEGTHGLGRGREPKMPKPEKTPKSEKAFKGGHEHGRRGIFGGHRR